MGRVRNYSEDNVKIRTAQRPLFLKEKCFGDLTMVCVAKIKLIFANFAKIDTLL